MAFIFLHTFWGVILFNALDKKIYWQVVVVFVSHMLVSCLVSRMSAAQCHKLSLFYPFTLYANFGLFQFSSKYKYDFKSMDKWGTII